MVSVPSLVRQVTALSFGYACCSTNHQSRDAHLYRHFECSRVCCSMCSGVPEDHLHKDGRKESPSTPCDTPCPCGGRRNDFIAPSVLKLLTRSIRRANPVPPVWRERFQRSNLSNQRHPPHRFPRATDCYCQWQPCVGFKYIF